MKESKRGGIGKYQKPKIVSKKNCKTVEKIVILKLVFW